MPTAAPLLKLANVSKRYDSPDSAGSLTVLNEVSLEVVPGESLAIVGPSGSGKSTLLQIIGTLDRPTSGTVLLDGQDLDQLGEVRLAAVRNRQLGFIFQAHYLLPQCTVLENVLVPTLAKGGHASGLTQAKSDPLPNRRESIAGERVADTPPLVAAPVTPASTSCSPSRLRCTPASR